MSDRRWHAGSADLVMRLASSVPFDGNTDRMLEAFCKIAPVGHGSRQEIILSVRAAERAEPLVPPHAWRARSGPLSTVRLMPGLEPLEDSHGLRYLSWPNAGVLRWRPGNGRADIVASSPHDDLGWMVACLFGTALHLSGAVRGLHAAVVWFRGRNLLVAGPSGSGKTTLALLLAAAGGALVAEDFCYVDRAARVAPSSLRDFATLRAGTWRWLADLLARRLPSDVVVPASDGTAARLYARGREGQVRLPIAAFGPPVGELWPVPVDGVLFPRIGPTPSTVRISPVTATDAHLRLRAGTDERLFDWMRELVPEALDPNTVGWPETVRCADVAFGIETPPEEVVAAVARWTTAAVAHPPAEKVSSHD